MNNDEDKIIFACKEHVEMALDDYVNFQEKAPQIIKVMDGDHVNCSYCEMGAEYKILS